MAREGLAVVAITEAQKRFWALAGVAEKDIPVPRQHSALEKFAKTPMANTGSSIAMNEARIAAGQNPLRADGTEILPDGPPQDIPVFVGAIGPQGDVFDDAAPVVHRHGG